MTKIYQLRSNMGMQASKQGDEYRHLQFFIEQSEMDLSDLGLGGVPDEPLAILVLTPEQVRRAYEFLDLGSTAPT